MLETRARFAADLERYIALEPQIKERQRDKPGLPYYLMALNYGCIEARAILAWADETLASLDLIASTVLKTPKEKQ